MVGFAFHPLKGGSEDNPVGSLAGAVLRGSMDPSGALCQRVASQIRRLAGGQRCDAAAHREAQGVQPVADEVFLLFCFCGGWLSLRAFLLVCAQFFFFWRGGLSWRALFFWFARSFFSFLFFWGGVGWGVVRVCFFVRPNMLFCFSC